jgi:hypothetical protein
VPGGRLPSGEYLIIVSNYFSDTVLDAYKRRWEIDVWFQCLKARGFHFEETPLQDDERLKR